MNVSSDPLTRVIAVILTLGLIAVSFVFGLFFFLVILGGSLLFGLIFWIRQKLKLGKVRTEENTRVIDAEFQVINKAKNDEESK